MARIYLIDAGEIQEGDVNIEYNPHNRIILTPEMRDEKAVKEDAEGGMMEDEETEMME